MEYHLSIIAKQQSGLLATLIRSSLHILTYPYLAVINTRNTFYKYGIIKSKRLPVKVISIGNITMGGTGKTPLVELSAKYLQKKGMKVAILSRGYGNKKHSLINDNCTTKIFVNDEYLVLRENLKDVPTLLGRDRVENGKKAINDYDVDCLILDDGFQHLRIKRDLDIVVIDSLNPFAEEFLIPRGTLREPLKNLGRADLFVLSHCNLNNEQTLKPIYARLQRIKADIPVCESIHKPVYIENIKNKSMMEPEWLKGKKVYTLCAIGNPESFLSTLKSLGAEIIRQRVFRDHHSYTQNQIDSIIKEAGSLGTDAIVVTQKDIVKIRNKNINNANILSLKIEMQITKGIKYYEEAMARILNYNHSSDHSTSEQKQHKFKYQAKSKP